MALINSTSAVILPFLFIFTLPIAILASITTFISFSILLVRVILIYIELALAIIPHYLLGEQSIAKPLPYSRTLPSATSSSTTRRKKRRSSSISNFSGSGTITPGSGETNTNHNNIGLIKSVGPTRDFEGVGGWRLDDDEDDDGDGDLWTSINSRLELPAEANGRRHHRRSLTSRSMPAEDISLRSTGPPETVFGGSRNGSSNHLMNSSKMRTPPSTVSVANLTGGSGAAGEYFSIMASGSNPKGLKRNNSGVLGQSGGSKGGLVMKQR